MDTIEAREDECFGGRCLYIFVNGDRLDRLLSRRTGDDSLLGLIPSWADIWQGLPEAEMRCIWGRSRIDGGRTTLPLLLCPDDFDFSCTVVTAEVTPGADTVGWNRFAADVSGSPECLGKKVIPLAGAGCFVFSREEYSECLKAFLIWDPRPESVQPPPAEARPRGMVRKFAALLGQLFPRKPAPVNTFFHGPNEDRQRLAASLSPWREKHFLHIGGFFCMGLDEQERRLLTVSVSGSGVFDVQTGERLARHYEEAPLTAGGECPGIGCLAGQTIPVFGLFGRRTPPELWAEGQLLNTDGATELKAVILSRCGRRLFVGCSDGVTVYERKTAR